VCKFGLIFSFVEKKTILAFIGLLIIKLINLQFFLQLLWIFNKLMNILLKIFISKFFNVYLISVEKKLIKNRCSDLFKSRKILGYFLNRLG